MTETEEKIQNLKPKQIGELNFWSNIKKNGCRGFTPEEWKVAVRHFRQYSLMYIDRTIGDLKNKVVVEIGCGPDSVLSGLKNVTAIGIDPLIDEYKKLWDLSKDNIAYICSDIEDLELVTQADIIICWNVLDHVSDIKLATEKIFEMLKTDGELWFMVNLEDTEDTSEVVSADPDSVHPFRVNINSLSILLKEAGFSWKERVITEFQISKRHPILMGVLNKAKL